MSGRTKEKWSISVAMVLTFCFLCGVILAIASGITKDFDPFYGVGIACFGTVLLTLLFTGFNKLKMAAVGVLPTSKTVPLILMGLIIGFGLSISQAIIVVTAGHTSLTLSPDINPFSVTANFLLYLFVAAREEFAFRGYPLATLNKNIRPIAAQTIIAGIFILEHFVGGMVWWQAILGPGIGAVLFGVAAIRSKGIAFPFGIHFAWNFGQWILGFKDQSGFFKALVDQGCENTTELTGWAAYVIVMGIGITIIYRIKIPSVSR